MYYGLKKMKPNLLSDDKVIITAAITGGIQGKKILGL